MYKFVKIEDTKCENPDYRCHPNWFLVVEPNGDCDGANREFNLGEILHDNTVKAFVKNDKFATHLDLLPKLAFGLNSINYQEKANQYEMPLLVRRHGTYMGMIEDVYAITDVVYSEHFPDDQQGKEYSIVVCENDLFAEVFWLEYLGERFPDKKVKVINNFRHRTKKELETYFNRCEYVTFSTTFSNLDWWENLSKAIQPHNKVIGLSHCEEGLKKALDLFMPEDLEIVKKTPL